MDVNVKIKGHKLCIVDYPLLASNSAGVDHIKIAESDWAGELYGYFQTGAGSSPLVVKVDDNNRVKIPAECLQAGGFYFGFFQTSGLDHITTELIHYEVKTGAGYTGEEPGPTPEIWEQFTQAAAAAGELLEQAISMSVHVHTMYVRNAQGLNLVRFKPAGYSYRDADVFSIYVNGLKLSTGYVLDPQPTGEVLIHFTPSVSGTVEIDAMTAVSAGGGGSVETDKTLTIEDMPADSKAAGDAIRDLDAQVTDHDTAITGLQHSVSELDGEVTTLDETVTTLDGTVTSQGGRITTAEEDILGLKGRMTTAEGSIQAHEGEFTTLKARTTANETNISTQAAQIGALQTADQALSDRISALENLGVADNIGY